MKSLNEYDLKQIRLIEKKIHLFESKKLDLFELVCDLNGLLNALESVPDSWKEEFKAETNTLEMIHDSIEDGSISKWRGNYKEDMHELVSNLKKMTTYLLEAYLRIPDPSILETAIAAPSNWLICPNCNDAWESDSPNAMVVCPKCERALHNPRVKSERTQKQP